MDLKELRTIIADEIQIATQNIQIPIKTGNLKNSIKWEITPAGFRIWLDEGKAPYAEAVDERSPYWTRFAMNLSMRLSARLGALGRREDY